MTADIPGDRPTHDVPTHKPEGQPPEVDQTAPRVHGPWLTRPKTVRLLWIVFIIILALTVLAQAIFHVHGYFGVDGWFGFNAVYGLGTCAIMVIVAKILGWALKRRDDYYDV